MTEQVSVSDIIERRPVGRLQVQLAVLCGLALLLDGADTIVIGLVGQGMAHTASVPVAALGAVFSVGQFGFFAGSLLFGPLGDQIGRKPVLVGSVAVFGLATALTALAHTVTALVVFRFLTGLGLGGAAPVAVSLVAEFLPTRARATVVALSWAAFPLGGAVIGLASTALLAHGWQFLFFLLGAVSVVVCLLMLVAVPESLSFLAAGRSSGHKMRKILRWLAPEYPAESVRLAASELKPRQVSVMQLFTERRAARTVLLWGAFFSSFLPLIFVTNWGPTILHQHGISPAEVGLAISLNSVGSALGSGGVGRAMDRLGTNIVVLGALGAAVLSLLAMGTAVSGFTGAAIAITAAGLFAGAGQTGVITLGSLLHPTLIRSTAMGWAMAMGRLGAATAPLLGSALLAAAWSPMATFAAVAAFPAAALAFVVLIRTAPGARLPLDSARTSGSPTG